MSFTNLDLEDFSNTNFTKVKQLTLYQKVYDLSIGSLTTTCRLAFRFTGLDFVETLWSARFMNTIFVSILTPTAFSRTKHRFGNKYIALRSEGDFEKPTPVRIIGHRLRIKLEKSDFQFNGEGEIVGLDLSKFKINQLGHFNDFPTLQSLNLSSQPIGDISFLAQLNRFHS